MRRITLWALSTLTTLVLLFSYHTSTSSHGGGAPVVAQGPAAAGSANGPSNGGGSSAGSSPNSHSKGSDESGSDESGSDESGSDDSRGSSGSGSSRSGPSRSGSGSGSPGSGSGGSSTPAAKTYDGGTAQTQWGPVQVRITVQGGKITDARAVVYPSGNGRDYEINSYALPILNQEAVQAQNANIDMVSGATVTSGGYQQSLQSAIDQAHL